MVKHQDIKFFSGKTNRWYYWLYGPKRGESLFDELPNLGLVVGTQKFHQVSDLLAKQRMTRKSLICLKSWITK